MKYVRYFILFGLIVTTMYFRNDIANYILRKTNPTKKSLVIVNNSYYSNNNLKYVSITDILNSGMTSYEFTCNSNYKECLSDVEDIIRDNITLASINNMVHPYNSYENISVNISNYGKVDVDIEKVYDDDKIDYINNFITDFINNNVSNDMSDVDKIKVFHDYVINNTDFDIEESHKSTRDGSISHTAYGLIVNHKAICGGYSDTMSIYLYMLSIPNYRISTNDHVWNLVYVDNTWKHLDLTWDDPVTSDGSKQLLYQYFLIDEETLHKLDTSQHNYKEDIYFEAQ